MDRHPPARLWLAGARAGGPAVLGRVAIEGAKLELVVRELVDPARASGRGGEPGAVAALASIVDCAGGVWLLAGVERGRPRLIDPQTLGVVALLGRRREWRGADQLRSLFLPVRCDRRPALAGDQREQQFLVSRSLAGGVDLIRVCPGAPIERWWLGELSGRVELFANARWLALVVGKQLATIELAELVPGGCPLTDPREVALPLELRPLPPAAVASCGLCSDSLWILEHEGGAWAITQLGLLEGDGPRRRTSWALAGIEQPDRWETDGRGCLWIGSGHGWLRVEAGRGPQERSASSTGEFGPTTLEIDGSGHPWLWTWGTRSGELQRLDGSALAREAIERWPVPSELRVQQLVALAPAVAHAARDPRVIVHADELAELLAVEPELLPAWRRWFD